MKGRMTVWIDGSEDDGKENWMGGWMDVKEYWMVG